MNLTKHRITLSLALAALALVPLAGCNSGEGTSNAAPGGGANRATPEGGGGAKAATRPSPKGDGNEAKGNTIRIGVVASLSGDQKPWGEDSYNGAKMAVKEFNDAGGLNGKKVELLVGDSTSKPEPAKSAAEKLMSDGVIAIVGEVASGHTAQIANSAFERGVPVIAIGATRTDLTDIGSNVFRVCYTDAFQGPVMAKFAYEELGLRNVALMTDVKQPYSTGLSKSFAAYFEKLGGKIVDEANYETNQTQFSGQLTNLKAKNPDGLFLSGYFTEVGPIAQQAKAAGLNVKLLGGDGWDSTTLLNSGGEAIIGGFFCNHYNALEDRPEVKAFEKQYQAMYGAPPGTTMGALGYDAMKLTLDALKRAEAPNSKALTVAIENTEGFKGVSGSITLTGNDGDPPKRALVVEIDRKAPNGQKFAKAYDFFED